MFKAIFPKQGIFALPLIRELTVVLIIKVIIIFTIKHVYFSNPVPFDADHLFGSTTNDTAAINNETVTSLASPTLKSSTFPSKSPSKEAHLIEKSNADPTLETSLVIPLAKPLTIPLVTPSAPLEKRSSG